MTRTDTHRPSVINPDEYRFVSFHSHRDEDVFAAITEANIFRQDIAATGGKFSTHEHGGACHVCGNVHAMTLARFHHRPTNTYVEVGETCADKLAGGEAISFRSFRDKMKAGVEAKAGRAKAEAFLADNGLAAAWDVYVSGEGETRAHEIVSDIVGKLVQYGSISDKQASFIVPLLKQIADAPAIAAARKAEADAADPVPSGRITITGTVLTVKEQETPYGWVHKMLVRAAEGGYKLWGTVPSAIADDVQAGSTVTFTATLKPSPDDAKFGFFSRPSKAAIAA